MRDWLKQKRTDKGLTQNELADLVDVDTSLIGKYELGMRTPSVKTAKKIAEVLEFEWTRFYE